MKTSSMKESKFLKKEDVGTGVLLTVSGVAQHNMAMDDEPPDLKWCLTFRESVKPLALNSTNTQLCEQIFGSDETDDWVGRPIVLYTDPSVMYKGKAIGGIRVRAPKVKKPTAVVMPPPPVVLTTEMDDDDIPF